MTDEPLSAESWRTDLFDIPEYLDAVGVPPADPGLDLLDRLHSAHVRTFPFANVDIVLGQHPGVSPDAVQDQLVTRRRGGYCFEHSQIFAAALESLGFTVRRALGRVHSVTNTRTHMTVIVQCEGRRWLCDPGFGYSIERPVALEDGATQGGGDTPFQVTRVEDAGSTLWALMRAGDAHHYVDEFPVKPVDVETGHFITSRGRQSPFTTHLMVMRRLADVHVTITESSRTVRSPGHATVRQEISAAEAVDAVQGLGVILKAGEDARLADTVAHLV